MGKSAGSGRCVHCLKHVEVRNWDHVLPESWYPSTTPLNLAKWKIPSCVPCNREYGKIEQDLLISFGLCLDPNKPETKLIVEKSLRSIKPEYGKNRNDCRARERKQQKVLRKIMKFQELPDHGIFPNFGPEHDAGKDRYIGVPLPKYDLERLAEKIVRGIVYIENDMFIDDGYDLDVFVLNEPGAQPAIEMIDKFGHVLSRGPGIVVRRAVIDEDPRSGLYEIEIWEKAKLYASVVQKDSDGGE